MTHNTNNAIGWKKLPVFRLIEFFGHSIGLLNGIGSFTKKIEKKRRKKL